MSTKLFYLAGLLAVIVLVVLIVVSGVVVMRRPARAVASFSPVLFPDIKKQIARGLNPRLPMGAAPGAVPFGNPLHMGSNVYLNRERPQAVTRQDTTSIPTQQPPYGWTLQRGTEPSPDPIVRNSIDLNPSLIRTTHARTDSDRMQIFDTQQM